MQFVLRMLRGDGEPKFLSALLWALLFWTLAAVALFALLNYTTDYFTQNAFWLLAIVGSIPLTFALFLIPAATQVASRTKVPGYVKTQAESMTTVVMKQYEEGKLSNEEFNQSLMDIQAMVRPSPARQFRAAIRFCMNVSIVPALIGLAHGYLLGWGIADDEPTFSFIGTLNFVAGIVLASLFVIALLARPVAANEVIKENEQPRDWASILK